MTTTPKVLRTAGEMIQWRREARGQIGFVPTMGALHEGHATLLRNLRKRCDISVLSIFVNPTQFGPKEDLSKYPRTFENDLKIAAKEGVDIVFAPAPEEIYPHGYSTFVEETQLSQPFCGQFRPGHFRGVTTVVLKLFNLVRPQLALFGLKDAQQFFVLEKMVQDLHLDLTIEGVNTVRESDGLALSSRNAYLSPEERAIAPLIYQELTKIRAALTSEVSGASPAGDTAHLPIFQHRTAEVIPHSEWTALLESAKSTLENQGFRVQYLDCVTLPHFSAPPSTGLILGEPCLIAIAAYLGSTRLIDNVILHPKKIKKIEY